MLRKKTVTVLQPNAEIDRQNPVKVYEYNRILKEFENDKEFIRSLSSSGIDIDLYLLSSINYQIQKYQEINFGKDSIRSNHSLFTKLPIQLFQDFSVNGSLSIILREALLYQQQKNLKVFDIISSLTGQPKELAESDEFLQVLGKIQASLIESKFLKRPVISFSKNISAKDRKVYKSIVLSHGGTVVDSTDTTSATALAVTHMVEWNEEIDSLVIPSSSSLTALLASLNSSSSGLNSAVTDVSQQQQLPVEEEFIRPLAIDWEDNTALVHWYYYPDSYDEKIPREEIEVDVTETFANMAKALNITGSSGGGGNVGGGHTASLGGSDNSAVPMNIDDDGESSHIGTTNDAVTTKPAILNVCCRYIIDLERFNEWGNEEDYIVETNTADSVFDSSAVSTASGVDGGGKTGLTLTLKRKSKRKSTGGLSKAQMSQKGSQQQLAASSSTDQQQQQQLTKEQYSTTGYDASANLFLDVSVPSKRIESMNVTVSDLTNDADIKIYQDSDVPVPPAVPPAATSTGDVTDDDKKAAAESKDTTSNTDISAPGADKNNSNNNNSNTDTIATKVKSESESKDDDDDDDNDNDQQQPQEKKQKTDHNNNDDNTNDGPENMTISHLPSWWLSSSVSTFEREHLSWLNVTSSNTPNSISDDSIVDAEYLQIRDCIMTLSSNQSADTVYLSATQCRRVMAFNVNTILAVHSFLDAYGIINRNVPARLKSIYIGFPVESSSSSSFKQQQMELTDEEKKVVGRSLDEYLSIRLDALHKKTKLFVDIEQSIDSRLNSVAVERRDVQIQRAQLAMNAAVTGATASGTQEMAVAAGNISLSALSSR